MFENPEMRDEIEIVLRRMTAGRDYRRWSEDTINKIIPFVERIIEDDLRNQEEEGDVIGTLVIDEDIIITAMMMALCDEE